MNEHDPDFEACIDAVSNMQAFLHHELDDYAESTIREHLMACESCLENFDVEQMITGLIQRAAQPLMIPDEARARTVRIIQLIHEESR